MKQPKMRQFPGSKAPDGRALPVPVRPVPGWRLPSGQLLVEYALRAGFASSPLLLRWPLVTPEAMETSMGGSSLVNLDRAVSRTGSKASSPSGRNAAKVALAEGK
jgi:hypothetical protein